MYYEHLEPDFKLYFEKYKGSKITKIIKYSLEGGKCIRGFIVKHIMQTLSKKETVNWQPIVSIEILHAASLIIDDLPCMDNSKFRRKKNATFVEFGERESILTSFYMVSSSLKLLLEVLKDENLNKQKDLIIKLVTDWNELVGENLVLGQLLDLNEDVQKIFNLDICVKDNTEIVIIYKTSSLFSLSFLIGAIYSGVDDLDYEKFKDMGLNFGIMFQIMDDFCDMEEDKEKKNYNFVLSNGKLKSLTLYIQKKQKLNKLLKMYNINTLEMRDLISKIDEKLINKIESYKDNKYKNLINILKLI